MHLGDGENADQLLTRILDTIVKDKPTSISVNEFDELKSYDINGAKIANNGFVIEGDSLKKLADKDVREIAFTLARLEDEIGAPLSPPNVCRSDVEKRSTKAITDRLNKYSKRRTYEAKRISQLNPEVVDTQNSDTLSSIDTLNTLRDMDEDQIYEKYLIIFNMAKRDELFYKRRHPKAVMLHRTLDFELSASLRECEWIMGVNVDR